MPSPPSEQDHYGVLGVDTTASSRDIKKAFAKLAMRSHPDKHPYETSPKYKAAFVAARLAHDVLSDPVNRAKYDARYPRLRDQWAQYEKERLAEAAKAKTSGSPSDATGANSKASRSSRSKRRPKREHPKSPRVEEYGRSKLQRSSDNCVALKVGERLFYVHENILRKRSIHFKALVQEALRSTETPEITITGFDSDVVAAYTHYCYSGAITGELSAKVRTSKGPSRIKNKHILFAQLYAFGEKHLDAVFCNDVMDAITRTCDEPDPASGIRFYPANTVAIRTIYEGTKTGSPARRFLVGLYVDNKSSPDWLAEQGRENYPHEFLYDLTQALLGLRVSTHEPPLYYDQRRRWYKWTGHSGSNYSAE